MPEVFLTQPLQIAAGSVEGKKDYSGKKPEIVDPTTGTVRPVELFVAVLGA